MMKMMKKMKMKKMKKKKKMKMKKKMMKMKKMKKMKMKKIKKMKKMKMKMKMKKMEKVKMKKMKMKMMKNYYFYCAAFSSTSLVLSVSLSLSEVHIFSRPSRTLIQKFNVFCFEILYHWARVDFPVFGFKWYSLGYLIYNVHRSLSYIEEKVEFPLPMPRKLIDWVEV